jgi:hypothetical protein
LPGWGNLVYLTARFKTVLLPEIVPQFRRQYQHTLHTMPTFLFGKFRHAANLAFLDDSNPIRWYVRQALAGTPRCRIRFASTRT